MSFTLDMSSGDAFTVIRNPRLLDETTPPHGSHSLELKSSGAGSAW